MLSGLVQIQAPTISRAAATAIVFFTAIKILTFTKYASVRTVE